VIALLSLKPEFAERIFDGTKRFEYRKRIFAREDVDKVIVYATNPMKRIVGEFEFDEIILDTPASIWEKTSPYSGINRDRFFQYFLGKQKAYAISIKRAMRYRKPLNPRNMLPDFVPPQSFRYMATKESALLNVGGEEQCHA